MKLIREFELHVNKKSSDEILLQFYRKIEHYVHTFPCGCGQLTNVGLVSVVHPTLAEWLMTPPRWSTRMNSLDEKRQQKIIHHLETMKSWAPSDMQSDRTEFLEQLKKIPHTLRQLALDVRFGFCSFFSFISME